jgi:hypothetical protein
MTCEARTGRQCTERRGAGVVGGEGGVCLSLYLSSLRGALSGARFLGAALWGVFSLTCGPLRGVFDGARFLAATRGYSALTGSRHARDARFSPTGVHRIHGGLVFSVSGCSTDGDGPVGLPGSPPLRGEGPPQMHRPNN